MRGVALYRANNSAGGSALHSHSRGCNRSHQRVRSCANLSDPLPSLDAPTLDYLRFYLDGAGTLVTIGVCYEQNPRFSGGAYNSVVSKCESFATDPMKKSLKLREEHADKLLDLDEEVNTAVAKLKAAGWTSGYLKPIVVARINPLRFAKLGPNDKADFDKTIDKMLDGAKKFDASKVKAQDVAIAAAVGGGEDAN